MKNQKPAELRRDLHHGGWVLLPHQSIREQLLNVPVHKRFQSMSDSMASTVDTGAIILWQKSVKLSDKKEHTAKVVANPWALHRIEGSEERAGIGMYDQMRGIGAHEIIIESEEPGLKITEMAPQLYALTLEAIQARIRDLYNDSRLRSFTWFREWTCGDKSNNLPPHSQLLASTTLPLGMQNVLESAREHYEYKERCLFCDIIRQEQTEEIRLVHENKHYITFCPFASRYPFEVHLMPKQHQSDFTNEPGTHLSSLAEIIRNIAERLDQSLPGWRVIASLHTKPVFDPRMKYFHTIHKDFHWHIEFTPVPPGYVDWYARTGMHVEMTSPEQAAEHLRNCTISSPWE